MKKTVPHIVQYQGSKRLLAPSILQFMPHRFERLIEPFAGMAAITIAVAQRRLTQRFVLNDINAPLVGLLRSAIETPLDLAVAYTKVWNEQFVFPQGSIAHYFKVREEFNAGCQTPENMLYLLARCVKGAVRYGRNGLFNQSPDKRRFGTKPETVANNVLAVSHLLQGHVAFHTVDYREVLAQAQPGDIVYMDPPYQGVCTSRDNRYVSGIDFNDFVASVEELNRRRVDFLISYDGLCGTKRYGDELPERLGLHKILLKAGLSSQATLLGRQETTYEALYISRGLFHHLAPAVLQPDLFAACV